MGLVLEGGFSTARSTYTGTHANGGPEHVAKRAGSKPDASWKRPVKQIENGMDKEFGQDIGKMSCFLEMFRQWRTSRNFWIVDCRVFRRFTFCSWSRYVQMVVSNLRDLIFKIMYI